MSGNESYVRFLENVFMEKKLTQGIHLCGFDHSGEGRRFRHGLWMDLTPEEKDGLELSNERTEELAPNDWQKGYLRGLQQLFRSYKREFQDKSIKWRSKVKKGHNIRGEVHTLKQKIRDAVIKVEHDCMPEDDFISESESSEELETDEEVQSDEEITKESKKEEKKAAPDVEEMQEKFMKMFAELMDPIVREKEIAQYSKATER